MTQLWVSIVLPVLFPCVYLFLWPVRQLYVSDQYLIFLHFPMQFKLQWQQIGVFSFLSKAFFIFKGVSWPRAAAVRVFCSAKRCSWAANLSLHRPKRLPSLSSSRCFRVDFRCVWGIVKPICQVSCFENQWWKDLSCRLVAHNVRTHSTMAGEQFRKARGVMSLQKFCQIFNSSWWRGERRFAMITIRGKGVFANTVRK